eukprot:m51a1_g7870 hypothetical protein (362) ;mRNA; r:6743-14340
MSAKEAALELRVRELQAEVEGLQGRCNDYQLRFILAKALTARDAAEAAQKKARDRADQQEAAEAARAVGPNTAALGSPSPSPAPLSDEHAERARTAEKELAELRQRLREADSAMAAARQQTSALAAEAEGLRAARDRASAALEMTEALRAECEALRGALAEARQPQPQASHVESEIVALRQENYRQSKDLEHSRSREMDLAQQRESAVAALEARLGDALQRLKGAERLQRERDGQTELCARLSAQLEQSAAAARAQSEAHAAAVGALERRAAELLCTAESLQRQLEARAHSLAVAAAATPSLTRGRGTARHLQECRERVAELSSEKEAREEETARLRARGESAGQREEELLARIASAHSSL